MAGQPRIVGRGSQTGAQSTVIVSGGDNVLSNRMPVSYKTYREIRKHPTVAFARAMAIAPIVASRWTVDARPGTPPERVAFVKEQLLPIRQSLLETAMKGCVDFGWQPNEKIFDYTDNHQLILKRLKPLLHDLTEILADEDEGNFMGFRQRNASGGMPNDLDVPYCLLFNMGVEGTNWYGEGRLESLRPHYTEWIDAGKGASRYDRKIAGSSYAVYFPIGTSNDGVGGAVKDNAELAKKILDQLESSGNVAIPQEVTTALDALNAQSGQAQWRVEVLSDSSPRQGGFIDRQSYLDKLFVRAFLIPERALLEGQYGTKAEAGVHADFAITQRELEHEHLLTLINWHLVDQLLAQNWGDKARGSVWLCATPLQDNKIDWLRTLYAKLLENPSGFMEELGTLDRAALKQLLGVPVNPNLIQPEKLMPITSEDGTPLPAAPPPAEDSDDLLGLAGQVGRLYHQAINGT